MATVTECAWCGGELTLPRFKNRRGEIFCTAYHRTASNGALRSLLGKLYPTSDIVIYPLDRRPQ